MIHRFKVFIANCFLVVNCFQNTTLVDDSQGSLTLNTVIIRCELLSEYYFSR